MSVLMTVLLAGTAVAVEPSSDGRSNPVWFHEDFTETPPEVPVQQNHVANRNLILKRYGPGEKMIKKSFHENIPGDPYYVWSGLCRDRWALAFEHRLAAADLSRFGRVRWRTRQSADRVLYVIVRSEHGWLVSGRGTPATSDWKVDEIDLTECQWFQFDIEKISRGELVASPSLRRVHEVGFTDLMIGDSSRACSRLDWIEVDGESAPLPSRH